MRKLSAAVLGILCAFLFTVHSVYASALMLGLFSFTKALSVLGRILVTLLLIHAAMSLLPLLYRTAKTGLSYPALQIRTLIQAGAGILLLFYSFYHVFYLTHEPAAVPLFLLLLTLAAVGIHLFIGLPNCCITLGLLKEETDLKKAKAAAVLIGIVPTLLSAAAFISYYPRFYGGT